jgi:hypothetical protein
MPALVAGIHVAEPMRSFRAYQPILSLRPDVDGRDKPGHDDERAA